MPYEKQVQEIEKSNMELLWAISDGSRTDMDAWAGKDVFEFFMGLWIHEDRIEHMLEGIKKANSHGSPA